MRTLIVASIVGLFVALTATAAHATAPLNDYMVDNYVLPWIQTGINGDDPGPLFTVTGDPFPPSWASLDPSWDSWGDGESVAIQDQGGVFLVLSSYGGVQRLDTLQPTEKH